MSDNTGHLTNELILMSIVDEESLNGENQEHLAGCASCSSKRTAMLTNLEGLGHTAAKFCPTAPKPMAWQTVDVPKRKSFFAIPKPVYAFAGMMVFLFVAIMLIPGSGIDPHGDLPNMVANSMDNYELAEVYLPSEYIYVENELTGESVNTFVNFSDTLDQDIYEMANTYLSADYLYLAGESMNGSAEGSSNSQASMENTNSITLLSHAKGVTV